MKELINDLSSLRWWVSVVIVGFLINIASDYARPWIDRVVSRFSESRRLALTERQKHFEETVEEVLANPVEYISLRLDLLGMRLQVILLVVLGLFMFLLLDALAIPTEVQAFLKDRLPTQMPFELLYPPPLVAGLIVSVTKVIVGYGIAFACLQYIRRLVRTRAIWREVRNRKKKQSLK